MDHDDQAFIDALRDIDPNPTMIASQVAMTPAVRWIRVERRLAIELDDPATDACHSQSPVDAQRSVGTPTAEGEGCRPDPDRTLRLRVLW